MAEDKTGAMLPCNVIVQEKEARRVLVSAVNPAASMQAIENKDLQTISSNEISTKLQKVIKALKRKISMW